MRNCEFSAVNLFDKFQIPRLLPHNFFLHGIQEIQSIAGSQELRTEEKVFFFLFFSFFFLGESIVGGFLKFIIDAKKIIEIN